MRGVGSKEPRGGGKVRPGAHRQVSLIIMSWGGSPPMSSLTTRLLSLHPRTPQPPRMAYKDQSTRVRISIRVSVEGSAIWTALDWGGAHAGSSPTLLCKTEHWAAFPKFLAQLSSDWLSQWGKQEEDRSQAVYLPHSLCFSWYLQPQLHNLVAPAPRK